MIGIDFLMRYLVENAENSMSEPQDFKTFLGGHAPDPHPPSTPKGLRLRGSLHSPPLQNLEIKTNTPYETPATRLEYQLHHVLGIKQKTIVAQPQFSKIIELTKRRNRSILTNNYSYQFKLALDFKAFTPVFSFQSFANHENHKDESQLSLHERSIYTNPLLGKL